MGGPEELSTASLPLAGVKSTLYTDQAVVLSGRDACGCPVTSMSCTSDIYVVTHNGRKVTASEWQGKYFCALGHLNMRDVVKGGSMRKVESRWSVS